ncbi:MAG TPA: M56 family metallopeptidase [Bryobacteraceae bacterium]|nr:M56 family metallopeptidase [Bryobacteraceae bacterium]
MSSLSPQNLLAYSLQITLLISAGGGLLWLLRLRNPAVRLACFQLILVTCLVLPFLQIWNTRPEPRYGWVSFPTGAIATVRTAISPLEASHPFPWRGAVTFVLATGIGGRLIWIMLGLWSLRRYRRRFRGSVSIPPIGIPVRAQIFISDNVDGPITFGLRRPLILLPHEFEAMDSQSQEAILCHELIHVRRKDWLLNLLEELVLAVLWFEPAIWWLISEIRLAREPVVDRGAMHRIGSRDIYVDVLLQAARVQKPVRLAPVNSFLGRGYLVRRVASLVQSSTISRRRVIYSLAVVLGGAAFATRMAVALFPISSEVHAQQISANPIQVESGGDHLLHRAGLEYPRWVIEKQISGLVIVEISIDDRGFVADAHVVSGPQELRRAVLRSVLNWQYDPQNQPPGTVEVAIRFSLPTTLQTRAPVLSESPARRFSFVNEERTEMKPMMENTDLAEKGQLTGKVVEIRTHGAAERMGLRLPIQLGDAISADSVLNLQTYLRSIDKRLLVGLGTNANGEISVHVFTGHPGPKGQP